MKIIRYLLLALFVMICCVGTSSAVWHWVDELHLISDSYQYGDLYRLSNLPQFKKPRKRCSEFLPIPIYNSHRPVHLYIIGDSFTEKDRIGKHHFGATKYHYTHWGQLLHFKPDTSAINILLLETVERHFREKFNREPFNGIVTDSATFNTTPENSNFQQALDLAFAGAPARDRFDQFLFQNSLMLKLKELKASFNWKVFNRPNNEVTIVNDGRDIVYYLDTDTPHITSSFTKLPASSLDTLINNLNTSAVTAKKIGFDNIILSIIPNKVSTLAPHYGTYNRLIERVYSHPKMKMPYVSILPEFQKMGPSAYLLGDSHWTCEGQNRWVEKVNTKIEDIIHSSN